MKDIESLNNQKYACEDEGFSRLSTNEVRDNLVEIIRRASVEGDRIVLQQFREDVAAIIPIREVEKLGYIMELIKPSQYLPDEDEYYEDDRAIHCLYPDDIIADFDEILEAVKLDGELFGLLPTENMGGLKIDIFMPVAIFMSIDNFWVPEYFILEKKETDKCN